MKQRTLNRVRKMVAFALIAFVMTEVPVAKVSAAAKTETASNQNVEILEAHLLSEEELANIPMMMTMLINTDITIAYRSDGMHIDITTGANDTASVLGVKDVKIQKKVWYGWETVATSSGGEANNCTTMGVSIYYANAEYGATYRVSCVHYGNVNGYTEGTAVTDGYVYTY